MEPKKIILCPNPDRDTGMKATKSAIAILRDMGFQTVVCSPFRDPKTDAFGDLPSKPLLPELKGADLVITLGGDGTILHLAKLAALHKIPMLGINMGGLGFLAELEVGSLNALRGLKNWDFPIEERMMLDVSVLRDGKQIYTNMGLNDAVIREGPISHVIHLKVFSDGKHLADIAGDGAIIATPTGSTAYSLSAGGPVVEPVAQILTLTPICTHNMRFSSYVLSPDHTLTVSFERNGRKPIFLFVDESRAFPLHSNDIVQIRRSGAGVLIAGGDGGGQANVHYAAPGVRPLLKFVIIHTGGHRRRLGQAMVLRHIGVNIRRANFHPVCIRRIAQQN